MKILAARRNGALNGARAMEGTADENNGHGNRLGEFIRDSAVVIVTIVFVGLYAAAFAGKLDPLRDNTMLMRLEPLIFILLGYYFARFPSRQIERSMTAEIARLTKRADAAQFAKEKANEEREVMEERMRNLGLMIGSEPDLESSKAILKVLNS